MRTPEWKRQFALMYTGQAFSLIGSSAAQFALIWWITVTTQSAVALTVAGMVGFLPQALLGPFAGVWVDRWNRRMVMIVADALVALSSAVLGVAFLLGEPSLALVYAVLMMRALGSTFHMPAMQAAIPMLVPADQLMKAGGWGNMVSSASAMLGPVLGAAWMATLPVGGIMLLDVVGAALAIAALLPLKVPNLPKSDQPVRVWADLRAGFRELMRNRPLVRVTIPVLLASVVYMPLGSLYPLLIRLSFNGTAWHNGIAEVLFAGGMMASSAIMGIWGGKKHRFLMISAALFAFGAFSAAAGVLPTGGFWVFAALTFLMGGTGTFFSVPYMTYIQETTSPENMGKVMALVISAMGLAMPIGLMAAGPVSEAVGVSNWFLMSGAVMALTGVICRVMTVGLDRAARQKGGEAD